MLNGTVVEERSYCALVIKLVQCHCRKQYQRDPEELPKFYWLNSSYDAVHWISIINAHISWAIIELLLFYAIKLPYIRLLQIEPSPKNKFLCQVILRNKKSYVIDNYKYKAKKMLFFYIIYFDVSKETEKYWADSSLLWGQVNQRWKKKPFYHVPTHFCLT